MKNTAKVKFVESSRMPYLWHDTLGKMKDNGKALSQIREGDDCQTRDVTVGGCRRHVIVLPGYGKRDYPFPSADELVARAIAYFNELMRQYERMGMKIEIGESEAEEGDADEKESSPRRRPLPKKLRPINLSALGIGTCGARRSPFNDKAIERARVIMEKKQTRQPAEQVEPLKLIPDATGAGGPTAGAVARIGAGTLAHLMEIGKYEAAVAREFDSKRGAVNWALTSMPAKYRPNEYKETAESLRDQLDRFAGVVLQSLPRMTQFLRAHFPQASDEELLGAAISLLNEQLREILTVLSMWTESFAQRRDGMYGELDYVHFMVKQSLRLFQAGDALSQQVSGIKTHAFHINDVFMARYSDQGPATIPGSRGPVGAHLIDVPMYERPIIIIDLPIYGHEFWHDFYFDAENLPENMSAALVNNMKDAAKEGGPLHYLAGQNISLGKQSVSKLTLMTQIFGQTLSENSADVVGGTSLTGEGYGYSMLAVFGAFNIGAQGAIAANRLLRPDSYYLVGQQGELSIAPHLPDFVRLFAVAQALETNGFKDEAAEFRLLAEQAAGHPKTTEVVWRNADPRSPFRFEIRLPVEDLIKAMAVVVDTILKAPLAALNGLSTSQLVNWTPKRQEKVDALVKNLLAGKSDVPWEMGDFWAPYVAAAAVKAVWSLWKSGAMPPLVATQFVEQNARKMMDKVKERFEQLEEAATAASNQPAADTQPVSDKPVNESDATERAEPTPPPAVEEAGESKEDESEDEVSEDEVLDDEAPEADEAKK